MTISYAFAVHHLGNVLCALASDSATYSLAAHLPRFQMVSNANVCVDCRHIYQRRWGNGGVCEKEQ
jgi:hypothetical protein